MELQINGALVECHGSDEASLAHSLSYHGVDFGESQRTDVFHLREQGGCKRVNGWKELFALLIASQKQESLLKIIVRDIQDDIQTDDDGLSENDDLETHGEEDWETISDTNVVSPTLGAFKVAMDQESDQDETKNEEKEDALALHMINQLSSVVVNGTENDDEEEEENGEEEEEPQGAVREHEFADTDEETDDDDEEEEEEDCGQNEDAPAATSSVENDCSLEMEQVHELLSSTPSSLEVSPPFEYVDAALDVVEESGLCSSSGSTLLEVLGSCVLDIASREPKLAKEMMKSLTDMQQSGSLRKIVKKTLRPQENKDNQENQLQALEQQLFEVFSLENLGTTTPTSENTSCDEDKESVMPASGEEEDVVIHYGFSCDGCCREKEEGETKVAAGGIVGIRYHSSIQEDFDICASCEATGKFDDQGPFLKIKTPEMAPSVIMTMKSDDRLSLGSQTSASATSNVEFPTLTGSASNVFTTTIRKVQPPGHHCKRDLIPFRAVHDGFQCDVCHERKEKGSWLYGCRPCDYDVCASCFHGLMEEGDTVVSPKRTGLDARFVGVSNIPEGTCVRPGEFVYKSWVVENTGTEAWPEGTTLVFDGGQNCGTNQEEEFVVPLAQPSQRVRVTASFRMPQKEGEYKSQYRLHASGSRGCNTSGIPSSSSPFGQRLQVNIIVGGGGAASAAAGEKTVVPVPSASSPSPQQQQEQAL